MYNNNQTKSTRPIIATPANASEELHASLVSAYTRHFSAILTPQLMIAHRKGCYATVINGTHGGLTLEQGLGTANAKVATEQILNSITASFSEVPQG